MKQKSITLTFYFVGLKQSREESAAVKNLRRSSGRTQSSSTEGSTKSWTHLWRPFCGAWNIIELCTVCAWSFEGAGLACLFFLLINLIFLPFIGIIIITGVLRKINGNPIWYCLNLVVRIWIYSTPIVLLSSSSYVTQGIGRCCWWRR